MNMRVMKFFISINKYQYLINVFLGLKTEIKNLRELVYRMQLVVSVNVCCFEKVDANDKTSFDSSSITLKLANGKIDHL